MKIGSSRMKRLVLSGLILLGITGLLFVALEVGAFLVLSLYARTSTDPRSAVPLYKAEPWGATYWREIPASGRFMYESYVVWRRIPYAGTTIVVDARGLRRTLNTRCDGKTYLIYMFGGSTLWGTGVPDWGTIPSLLADRLTKDGRPVCIVNYGESSWVSTQEVIKLMLELKSDRKPDLVIFLDGANDIYTGYQLGPSDLHSNFDQLKRIFETANETRRGSFSYLFKTNTTTLLERLIARARTQQTDSAQFNRSPADIEQLANSLVESYLRNMDFIEVFARRYAFDYAVFWQPIIFAEGKPLSAEEEKILRAARRRSPGLPPLYQAAYRLVRNLKRSHLYYIADVFNANSDDIYIDMFHYGPEGNRLVAQRIYQVVRTRLGSKAGWQKSR
ncbi:MAG: SGNH/GDSL hydrolase family protein [Candidatus Rokubacteria bacterium]|nr:SGNH/GDSL hydrolase family protein [Candidatus Rokubacteria bacterium]